jgi:hypothetical protein
VRLAFVDLELRLHPGRAERDAPAPCCSAAGRVYRWSGWLAGIRAYRRRPAISAGPSSRGRYHTLPSPRRRTRRVTPERCRPVR